MTEIERTRATIAHLRAKLRASSLDGKQYYELCLAGWLCWLKKLTTEHDNDSNRTDPR